VATDDASSDGTVEILDEYARRRGLRYAVNRERLGVVRNFERALSMAQGEYIALADQDDLWKPEKIATLVENLGGHTLAYTSTLDYLDPQGIPRTRGHDRYVAFARQVGSGKPVRQLLAENWVVSHTMLFRRELLAHALPFPPGQRQHDGWLALVAASLSGIRHLDARLQIYRQHESSVTFPGAVCRQVPRPWWQSLFDGSLRADWRRRCQAEVARLEEARAMPLLDASHQAFLARLLTLYRSGLDHGFRMRACVAGLRVAPYFASSRGPLGALKLSLRPLLVGA
jgi:hypothetical protein